GSEHRLDGCRGATGGGGLGSGAAFLVPVACWPGNERTPVAADGDLHRQHPQPSSTSAGDRRARLRSRRGDGTIARAAPRAEGAWGTGRGVRVDAGGSGRTREGSASQRGTLPRLIREQSPSDVGQ